MPIYCCVRYCKRNSVEDKDHSFFGIPNNPITRPEWIRFAVGADGKVTTGSRICSDHFEKKYITKMFPRPLLARNSVPTLRGTDISIKEEPEEDSPKTEQVDFENSETSSRELQSCVIKEEENNTSDVELKFKNVREVRISGENLETFSIQNLGDCVITVLMNP